MAKASEIAAWLGTDTRLDDTLEILSVSSIESAGPTSVVFATDAKTLARALESSAGIVLANQTLNAENQETRILSVPDARFAFANVAND